MKSYKDHIAAILLPLTISFTNTATAQESLHISPEQQIYQNRPENEFVQRFTAATVPEGINIKVDCDDVMPAIDPRNGKFNISPRWRFMARIYYSLPVIKGYPVPKNIDSMVNGYGANTVDARSVGSMYKHLLEQYKVPNDQIINALKKCRDIRAQEFNME